MATSTSAAVSATPSALRSSTSIDATGRAGRAARPVGIVSIPRAQLSPHGAWLLWPVSPTAWGYGLTTSVATGAAAGTVLDTWYPEPALGEPTESAAPLPRD